MTTILQIISSVILSAATPTAFAGGHGGGGGFSRGGGFSGGADFQSAKQPGDLIIRRLPNLGNDVIVSVYLDGLPFTSVLYGQTFQGNLPPGRHVLSVQAAPNPKYVTATITTLDVQHGETYEFTAQSNRSGNLALK